MSRKLLLLLTLSALTLSACGKTPEEIKKADAASALAESTCGVFALEEDYVDPNEIAKKYGFKDAQELDDYITSLKDSPEAETLRTEVAKKLTSLCGEDLTSINLTAEYMAKEIVGE